MKILKKVFFFLIIIFALAQFFKPEENNGDLASLDFFIEETKPNAEVLSILKNSCFDCHSNKTKYPWYNKITPINYWLESHVKDGKKHLNFSKWELYSLKKKAHKMGELHEEVAKKRMPLDSYTWTHKEANLSQEQIDAVVSWGKKLQQNYKEQLKTK